MFSLTDHSSKRISEIELMRFFAAFLILCCHMNGTTNYGWIAVEFFFILSGIMMARSASRILAEKEEINIGIETKNMIVKKIRVPALFHHLFDYLPFVLLLQGRTDLLRRVMGSPYLTVLWPRQSAFSNIFYRIKQIITAKG